MSAAGIREDVTDEQWAALTDAEVTGIKPEWREPQTGFGTMKDAETTKNGEMTGERQ